MVDFGGCGMFWIRASVMAVIVAILFLVMLTVDLKYYGKSKWVLP